MNKHQIELTQTGHFSKLFLDYINQDKALSSFYKYAPLLDSFPQAIKDISTQKFNRKLLVDVITEQYATTGNCPLPTANCHLLLDENTFTVCTGHQLCLFTGPLYFIYKILSAINLAEQLNLKSKILNLKSAFVPVYWMASEDHDFEEVNHINLFGKKIEWSNKQGGAVGRYTNEGLKEVLDALKEVIGDSEHAKELLSLFSDAYIKHDNLSSATRYLVNELFGKYGLVIVDGDDTRLKNEMKEIFQDELTNQNSFKIVSKTIEDLEKHGYKAQVNPREINLFHLKDNDRVRIENKPGILSLEPATISPNVVIRPLYQQKILPNIAYVGGPGELAYWLEYKAMFEYYNIQFPVLVPRNFLMLVDQHTSEKLGKLGLSVEDIFLTLNEMFVKYISSISGDKVSFNTEREQLKKQYKSIEDKLALVDKSLPSAAGAELKKQTNALDALEKKMLRAFKKKNADAVAQIEKLKEKFIPGGVLQERYENFIPYYLKHGKSFPDVLKKNIDPFDNRFIILSE